VTEVQEEESRILAPVSIRNDAISYSVEISEDAERWGRGEVETLTVVTPLVRF